MTRVSGATSIFLTLPPLQAPKQKCWLSASNIGRRGGGGVQGGGVVLRLSVGLIHRCIAPPDGAVEPLVQTRPPPPTTINHLFRGHIPPTPTPCPSALEKSPSLCCCPARVAPPVVRPSGPKAPPPPPPPRAPHVHVLSATAGAWVCLELHRSLASPAVGWRPTSNRQWTAIGEAPTAVSAAVLPLQTRVFPFSGGAKKQLSGA